MRNKIFVFETIGSDIRTRAFFRRDIESLIKPYNNEATLNFIKVEFISRSVADEICNLLEDYPLLTIEGMTGDVEMMYNVVNNGRKKPREYPKSDIKVFHLKTMKDLSDFLCTL